MIHAASKPIMSLPMTNLLSVSERHYPSIIHYISLRHWDYSQTRSIIPLSIVWLSSHRNRMHLFLAPQTIMWSNSILLLQLAIRHPSFLVMTVDYYVISIPSQNMNPKVRQLAFPSFENVDQWLSSPRTMHPKNAHRQ